MDNKETSPNKDPAPTFRMAETRWTQVIMARGESSEAKMALQDLTGAYYEPVFRFIRDRSPDQEARDLTQAFFARVLDRYGFDGADPKRGRFRSFLLGAVKHFLAEEHARAGRQKRGGGIPHQSLDAPRKNETGSDIPALEIADQRTLPPDEAFDRHWANTVLERTLTRLEKRCQSDGKEKQFQILHPWLAGHAEQSQADAAKALGLSESAIRVALHRLRQRFRESLRSELAQTIGPHVTVEEELQHLFSALR